MRKERFWTKSYDPGIEDLDPSVWEISFSQAIQSAFDEFPTRMAMEYLGVEFTFQELDHYANRFAHFLLNSGLKKGDCIGINMPNCPQYIIVLLGAIRIGCVFTGVSALLSADQMVYQLKDAEVKALVTLDAIYAGRIVKEDVVSKVPTLELIIHTSVGSFLPKIKQVLGKLIGKIPKGKITPIENITEVDFLTVIKDTQYSKDFPKVSISPDDLFCLLYTGGTTGPPKGTMLTNRNMAANMFIIQNWLGWERGKGAALSGFPFFHIAGIFFCINTLYLGWPQILIPNPRDTDHICAGIEKYKPSVLANVPSLYQLLLQNPKFKSLDHSQLEFCVSGASPFPKESQKAFENIVGEGKILEVYGMTETSAIVTMNPSKGLKKLGTVGLPITNADLKLVDPETGEEVPLGEAGEVVAKGPMIFQAYWKKPEETKNVFLPDGYMRTGDVAIFDDDGYLRIVDRTKDMIIVGGFKVFSSKVEDTLTNHPGINTVALIGIPNPDRPGSEVVKAYVVPTETSDPETLEADITAWAKENCAPYEVPKIFEFRKELPLTMVGKVDKKILRDEANPG